MVVFNGIREFFAVPARRAKSSLPATCASRAIAPERGQSAAPHPSCKTGRNGKKYKGSKLFSEGLTFIIKKEKQNT
ncbi:hypothetical protein [Stappia sp.]|uniref:hypothetical protein n=1 Tax=Stappia sp. TaxID=1870903 RepID=UPI003C7E902E